MTEIAAFADGGSPREPVQLPKRSRLAVARKSGFFVFLLLAWAAVSRPVAGQNASDFRVIVHPSNPINSLSTADVSRFFMEHNAEWPGGTPSLPIDLSPESPLRSKFSAKVLGRDVAAVRAHWRRLIFQGKGVPPPTRSSEREIVQFVSSNQNAIGYVSTRVASSADVKAVDVTD
jgi:ABC-type phosphate transport system substrate-binding protein